MGCKGTNFSYLCRKILKAMKKFVSFALLAMCMCANASEMSFKIGVSNSKQISVKDYPVVVSLKDTKFAVKSAMVTLNGIEVPCQFDDMDGDLCPDELVFLADVNGATENKYDVCLRSEGEQKNYPARVYANMGLNDKYGKYPTINNIEAAGSSYLFKDVFPHGAEFESELTAYRVYFDNRQNIDLYGKRKQGLELERTHFYSMKKDLDEGMGNDVLWAGGSMGCGTLREFKDGSPVLVENVKLRGERIIAYGPLRTVVEMKDLGWNGNNIKTHYILYAGHREVEVQVFSDGPLAKWQMCTGVQKVGQEPFGWVKKNGLAVSWGKDYPDYGKKELYAPEAVGLAVYVPETYLADVAEDELQYMCVLKLDKQHTLKYFVTFCADMEKESGFHSAAEWIEYVQKWMVEKKNDGVKIKISK